MSLDNDYEKFAYDVVKFILDRAEYRPTDALCKAVSAMLMRGPHFTRWPADVVEATQRARDAARERARPVLPTLPRVPVVPTLPRVPVVPRVLP